MRHEIVLGGGCFWCLEAAYKGFKGIIDVIPGYAGGQTEDPDYKTVCNGSTGHAEVVKVLFEDTEIGLEDVLRLFFAMHDPTTVDRQGNDVGSQYRSIILYSDGNQYTVAQKIMQEWRNENPNKTLVTVLEPLTQFYPAEEYHKRYYEMNPQQSYCRLVIKPKLQKVFRGNEELMKRQ